MKSTPLHIIGIITYATGFIIAFQYLEFGILVAFQLKLIGSMIFITNKGDK